MARRRRPDRIAAGLVTFLSPGTTALTLLYFIGFWAIATGIFEIIGAVRLRKDIDNEWMLIVTGVLSVLFGVILFVRPGAGALGLLTVIGIYAILRGVSLIGLASASGSSATPDRRKNFDNTHLVLRRHASYVI